jgi:drug/metabolite transporter (DMT)-like permease
MTVGAALLQCWRTALQQKLRHLLSVNAAGFVRFLYGAPTALLIYLGGLWLTGTSPLRPNTTFLLYCAAGGLFQILATNLLIMSFGYRNFAVGTAYAKTEAAQSAVIALIILNEVLKPQAWAGIALGLCGVMTLSLAGRGMKPRDLLAATLQPAALCGLGAGFLFAFTTVFIKLANHALPDPNIVIKALFGVVVTNTMQIVMQGGWLAWREPRELHKTFTTWRSSMWAGTLSAAGSACWFTGFALADVALVRSVGQIEIVFTLLFSRFYLHERLRWAEVSGLVLVVAGVLVIILTH